jgi:hypothetical protein
MMTLERAARRFIELRHHRCTRALVSPDGTERVYIMESPDGPFASGFLLVPEFGVPRLTQQAEPGWLDWQEESVTAAAVISEAFYSPSQPRHPKGSPLGGQWAKGGGGTSPLITALAEAAMEGGFTYDTRTKSQPTSGHVVALRGRSSIKPAKNKTEAALQIKEFLDQPNPPSPVIGGWHDKKHGEIVLDYVQIIEDRDEAIRVGQENNQQAIFDLGTLTEIDTGGTGDRETGGVVEESPDG